MRKVLASIAFGAGLVLAAPLLAEPAAKDKPAAAEEDLSGWTQRLDEAAARLASAQKQVDELLGRKGKGAARRYPRGDAKEKYLQDLDDARKELADAKRALPALLDEARRAGVPAGVLDRYEGLVVDSAATEEEDETYAEPQDEASPDEAKAPPAKAEHGDEEDAE